jgi:hypothetical protein
MKTLISIIIFLCVISFGILTVMWYASPEITNIFKTPGETVSEKAEVVFDQTVDQLASSSKERILKTKDSLVASTSEFIKKPISISVKNLPETQRAMLSKLGFNESSITITPENFMCAQNALGVARMNELSSGGTPSITEGLTLLSCLKK